jgi:hypothetical protein
MFDLRYAIKRRICLNRNHTEKLIGLAEIMEQILLERFEFIKADDCLAKLIDARPDTTR